MKTPQRLKSMAAKLTKSNPKPTLPEECWCPCHRGAMLLHPIDCCKPCPHCHRGISTAFYNAHVEQCAHETIEHHLSKSA